SRILQKAMPDCIASWRQAGLACVNDHALATKAALNHFTGPLRPKAVNAGPTRAFHTTESWHDNHNNDGIGFNSAGIVQAPRQHGVG
ncbi:MAG: hypothetical protein P8N63_05505, partial [Pseudomonadales bacterium]|nr:hypothetical protein [Pseudomonadales bacterium]